MAIYSGFSHWKWWFSIVFCMFTRGYVLKTRERKTSSRLIHRKSSESHSTASAGFFPFWLLAVLVIHDPRFDIGNMQQVLKSRRINTGLLGLKYTLLLVYVDLGPIYHATQLQQTPNFFVGSYVYIYIYTYMLENIWRKSVSLWAKCIYIYT